MHHSFGAFPATSSAAIPCNQPSSGGTLALASPPPSPPDHESPGHKATGLVGPHSSDRTMGYSQGLNQLAFPVRKNQGEHQKVQTDTQIRAPASTFSCPQDSRFLRPPYTHQSFTLAPASAPTFPSSRDPAFPRLAQPIIDVSPASVATQHPLYSGLSPRSSSSSSASVTSPPSHSPKSPQYWLCRRKPASRTKRMPRRPGKRLGAASDDEHLGQSPGDNKVKLPRLDRAGDFSGIVKNRLQSYTRTGQACDRCKVRKIRCDALPEGCSHCKNQNLECLVTDRVTGRTERRGYLQELERKESDLVDYIRDLEKLLGDKGVQVKPYEWPPATQYASGPTSDNMGNQIQDPTWSNSWSQAGNVWFKDSTSSLPPTFRRSLLESRRGEAHIGVRGDDSAPLSSIRGTQLSILGMTIDFASFEAHDVDEPPFDAKAPTPLYNKSTQAFLQSAMHVNPVVEVNLPIREEAIKFAEFYFLTIGCFLPIPHKPTFMRLLMRTYDEPNFVPSTAELVQLHMVFAIIFFQFGVRNWDQTQQRTELDNRSNQHYHFALSKLFELTCVPDFDSVQAMALVCVHTRAFPKPGCASIVVQHALQRALELGLHRESRKPGEGTNLNHEMRKRVWWVILTVFVAINGRRGLPMPISVEEFDVGFPEPINDELLKENGVDTTQNLPCTYEVGIHSFKIVPILMEMWSNIYSVRRDAGNYVNIVKALEAQIKAWDDELPNQLKLGHPEQIGDSEKTRMNALILRTFLLEFRLLLRHPSVAMTNDKDMMAENSRICEDVAKEMLETTMEVQMLKCLDTTWYQMSIYAAFIFTTLVAHWERRLEMTPEEFTKLRKDMENWIGILEETGNLLGSGPRISEDIKRIIGHTMALIEGDMRNKNQGSLQPSSAQLEVKQEPLHPSFKASEALQVPVTQATPVAPASMQTGTIASAPSGMVQSEVAHKQYYQEPSMNGQVTYPTLTYNDQAHNNMAQSPYDAQAMFYNQAQAAQAAVAAAVVTTAVPGSSMSFAQQVPQHMAPQQPGDMLMNSRGTPWHDWTAAMAGTQDRFIATTLSTFGGPRDSGGQSLPVSASGLTNDINEMWPMTVMPHPTDLE